MKSLAFEPTLSITVLFNCRHLFDVAQYSPVHSAKCMQQIVKDIHKQFMENCDRQGEYPWYFYVLISRNCYIYLAQIWILKVLLTQIIFVVSCTLSRKFRMLLLPVLRPMLANIGQCWAMFASFVLGHSTSSSRPLFFHSLLISIKSFSNCSRLFLSSEVAIVIITTLGIADGSIQ